VFTRFLSFTILLAAPQLSAAVLYFGDVDCVGLGCYGASDPTAGSALMGVAVGTVDLSNTSFGHAFPFDPEVDDFAGTDRIYVSSSQTQQGDGYSSYASRASGPQTLVLDYSSLVPVGHQVLTLTLGIAADDFQFPLWGNAFTASINGSAYPPLTNQLNALSQTGPRVQFFTIGLPLSYVNAPRQLTISIDQAATGRDGWAVDFLTVGVTTEQIVPEPSSVLLLAGGLAALAARRRRR
jgi:hypothetical protein